MDKAREERRLALQAALDGEKSAAERNRLGQFATPAGLATEILSHARGLLPARSKVRFLDPAFGTGSFFSALRRTFPAGRVDEAVGVELDGHYGEAAKKLWAGSGLRLKQADFTQLKPAPNFNLLVCNPPYVRHHHLKADDKIRLQHESEKACGVRIGGLAGLYCYFIALSHAWLAPGAVSIWLVPSEFMDVNYGQAVKRYLVERVTLLHIHRFDPNDVQFTDALVSSAIVCFRNEGPPTGHQVTFTFGGTLTAPRLVKTIPAAALADEAKWTRFPIADVRSAEKGPTLADFFKIKRGLATGDNRYFILSAEEIAERKLPAECFKPILPSPRYLDSDEVTADQAGMPKLPKRLFLLDTRLPEDEIERRYPTLAAYLSEGKARGLNDRYLCRHRTVWYSQEHRPPAPIVCTYLGRGDKKNGRPFRFILNHSSAVVANVYLAMYPTPAMTAAMKRDGDLVRKVWEFLNSIPADQLLGEGRVYGGGLHKLEPLELANVPVPDIVGMLDDGDVPRRQARLAF